MTQSSTEHVHPASAVSDDDLALDAVLARFAKTTTCPNYVKVAYAAWRAELR